MVKMSKSQDVCDEAVTKIKVQIPGSERHPASLEVRVDTGAQGNIHAFENILPNVPW